MIPVTVSTSFTCSLGTDNEDDDDEEDLEEESVPEEMVESTVVDETDNIVLDADDSENSSEEGGNSE